MRILLVHPAADFSVSDVARGYRAAFVRAGHEVHDYELGTRMQYHYRAMSEAWRDNLSALSKQATETVVVEAMYHHADLVVIVSGLIFHPLGLQLLRQAGFPTVALHTESPYEDANQVEWSSAYPEMRCATHERTSAERYGWLYLPHAYDPDVHRPVETIAVADVCDVLMVGTGFPERVALLEQIDWTGINLQLRGLWPTLTEASPLWPFYRQGCIDNRQLPARYAGAKICLNLHRHAPDAVSLNPRAYELAACGAFTLTDHRAEGWALFNTSQPPFTSPASLAFAIRRYLAAPAQRIALAEQARRRVQGHTFDARAAVLLAALSQPAAEPLLEERHA